MGRLNADSGLFAVAILALGVLQSMAADAPIPTVGPLEFSDQRNTRVPTSGSNVVVGLFRGNPASFFNRDLVFACIPASADTTWPLWLTARSVDGSLEAHYKFEIRAQARGALVRLDLTGKNLTAGDFAAYKNAEVAISAFLGPTELERRQWLVTQFGALNRGDQTFLQLNGDIASSSTIWSPNAAVPCEPLAAVAQRDASTVIFNAVCRVPGFSGSGKLRLLRRSFQLLIDDLTLVGCDVQ